MPISTAYNHRYVEVFLTISFKVFFAKAYSWIAHLLLTLYFPIKFIISIFMRIEDSHGKPINAPYTSLKPGGKIQLMVEHGFNIVYTIDVIELFP